MKVAVLGAGGTIAPAIVRDLGESEEVSELLLLDLDRERAAVVAASHGSGKAHAAQVDARASGSEPGSLAAALAGCEVLVNSASYRVNLDAMHACLAAGVHYLDLGGLYWMTGRQLALHDDFERAGLLAILGIGSSPGKTNLMAARAVRELGRRPEAIHVSAAGRDLNPPEGFSVPYSVQTLVDELSLSPVVLRDGRPREIAPLTPGGTIDFGPPLGEAEAIHTLHSELRTFGPGFGCAECSFRLALHPELLERLRGLVGAAPEEIERAAAEAQPPSGKTVAVHLVEAAAEGMVVRIRCVTYPVEAWNLGGGIVSTAAPSCAVVRLIARGRVTARGVLPPEAALRPDEVFAELERHGSRFEIGEVAEGALEVPGLMADAVAEKVG